MIYCVEDDYGIREMMVYSLNATGFEAKGLIDGEALFKELSSNTPDLIILDIMLPGEDGISILKKLKTNPATRLIPIIMATAKGSEYDKVKGLDLGADDYLAKPFGMMEMVSRIKAILRRVNNYKVNNNLVFKELELNSDKHQVYVNNKPIELTLKEYELLHLFMKNLGKVFTREQILLLIWGNEFMGETRTIDVHIGTLRGKLKEYGKYIETKRGVGYFMENKYEEDNI